MNALIKASWICALLATPTAGMRVGSHGIPGRFLAQPSVMGSATFTQLIDHANPKFGTFSQAYYWSDEFWAGPGSPVVLMTPGEIAIDGYEGFLSNATLPGAIAQEIGAAVVVLEHRYWGSSSPYPELTTANLQYLTLNQSIRDLTYFANNVVLPFTSKSTDNNARHAPWILVGGSYSGALTAWTATIAPGAFWAYVASSAVVEAITDFWEYYTPVVEGMPHNCSTDVFAVIDYMDGVLTSGNADEIYALKAKFGLESVEHNDDFMSVLTNGPASWQETDFTTSGPFFSWCDYIENAREQPSVTNASGVGLEKALEGYAAYIREQVLPSYCSSFQYPDFQGVNNTACMNTYNATSPFYTDLSTGNAADRQWYWFLCNQPFGYWQDGAPSGTPSLVSRLIDVPYYTRQCGLFFPPGPNGETYGLQKGLTDNSVNAYTKGWNNTHARRLIYTNGEWDPWRYATVSAGDRPGGALKTTADMPVNVIPQGRHCSDLIMGNGDVNAGCAAVQSSEIAQIKQWVSEWKAPS